MTKKQYIIIMASAFFIIPPMIGWAAANGYAWISVVFFIVWSIIAALLRLRVKGWVVDERGNSIVEKSGFWAYISFAFLAGTSGLTLLALGRDTPDFLQAIGWTLLSSGFAITVLFLIARLYVSRKMGGKA